MPRNKIYVFDKFGNVAGTINGVQVDGPAVAARNISYVPEGAIVSGVGTASFELPLQFSVNNAITKGTQVMIYQDDVLDGPVFWGRVIRRPRTLSNDGIYARIDCLDVLSELASVTCTSGFISRPGELAAAMLQRLLDMQSETRWAVRLMINNTTANFSAYGIEVLRAIGKFSGEHFSSYKRETYKDPVTNKPARRIVIGQFSVEKSGMRLVIPQKEYGNVEYTKLPSNIRAVKQAQFDDDANIINRMIPFAGTDLTSTAITLDVLYGSHTFTGYNSNYPVKRRLRGDVTEPTPLPGQDYPNTNKYYEYYIEDTQSIVDNRVSEVVYPRQDITPLSNNPGDVLIAATTLYSEALNYLLNHINPHLSLSISTEHRGDLRNIAGKTVYVRCVAMSKPRAGQDIYMMNINGDFRINKVEVQNADGEGTCAWDLSTDGRSVETNDILFQGALEDIDYLKKVPTILIGFPVYPIDEFIDKDHAVTKTFVNSAAFIGKQQVIMDLRFENVRSALRPLSHFHSMTIAAHHHSISVLAHHHTFTKAAHSHPVAVAAHHHTMTLIDHVHSFSNAGHADHTVSVAGHSDHSVSEGNHGHSSNAGIHYHVIIGTKPWIDLKAAGMVKTAAYGKNGETVVTDITASSNTADHTHGDKGASAGATYTTALSVGDGGSFTAGATTGGAINKNSGTGGAISQNTGDGGAIDKNTGDDGAISKTTSDDGAISQNTGDDGAISSITGDSGGLTDNTGGNVGAEWGLVVGPKPFLVYISVNGASFGAVNNNARIDITSAWNVTQDNVVVFTSIGTTDQSNPTGLGRLTGAVLARMIGTTLANQTL